MFELLNGEQWRRWIPVPLRIILGVGFMVHGWAKLSSDHSTRTRTRSGSLVQPAAKRYRSNPTSSSSTSSVSDKR
jgi:hypothetical protein